MHQVALVSLHQRQKNVRGESSAKIVCVCFTADRIVRDDTPVSVGKAA